MRYADIQHTPRSLLALTSLTPEEFAALLPAFTQVFEAFMADHTIVGGRRWDRRYTTYQNSPLPTMEDNLLFILTYLKTHPLQEVHGRLFGMSQSNANKWIHLLHLVLNAALAAQDALPARNAEQLATYFARKRAAKPTAGNEEPALFSMTAPSDR